MVGITVSTSVVLQKQHKDSNKKRKRKEVEDTNADNRNGSSKKKQEQKKQKHTNNNDLQSKEKDDRKKGNAKEGEEPKGGIDESLSQMDGRLLADLFIQKARKHKKDLTAIELNDISVPGMSHERNTL